MTELNLTDAEVSDFLLQHPDFFVRNSQLLEILSVPHETGAAVSLIERQRVVLREKTESLTARLSDLIEIARHNDAQFEKTKRLVINLLEAETLDDIALTIDESLCQDFMSDTTALILFSDKGMSANNLSLMSKEAAAPVKNLLTSNLPCCGKLSALENEFIFRQQAIKVQSCAVVPLVKGETLGLLAVGSFEANYFHSSQGTDLLSYVGEVISRIASRILHQPTC